MGDDNKRSSKTNLNRTIDSKICLRSFTGDMVVLLIQWSAGPIPLSVHHLGDSMQKITSSTHSLTVRLHYKPPVLMSLS